MSPRYINLLPGATLKSATRAAEKIFKRVPKKFKKKLVRALRVPLEGISTDKCSYFVVQKKFKKVKKKLVRVLEI
jgi:hypothetical protein